MEHIILLVLLQGGKRKLKMFENKALRRMIERERKKENYWQCNGKFDIVVLESIVIKSSQADKNVRTKGIHCF
jgi:hypothetical protein